MPSDGRPALIRRNVPLVRIRTGAEPYRRTRRGASRPALFPLDPAARMRSHRFSGYLRGQTRNQAAARCGACRYAGLRSPGASQAGLPLRRPFGELPKTAALGWPLRHLLQLAPAKGTRRRGGSAPALPLPPPAPPAPRPPATPAPPENIASAGGFLGLLSRRLLIPGVASAGLRPPARKLRRLRQGEPRRPLYPPAAALRARAGTQAHPVQFQDRSRSVRSQPRRADTRFLSAVSPSGPLGAGVELPAAALGMVRLEYS